MNRGKRKTHTMAIAYYENNPHMDQRIVVLLPHNQEAHFLWSGVVGRKMR